MKPLPRFLRKVFVEFECEGDEVFASASMLDLRFICHGIVFIQTRDVVDLRDQAVLMDQIMDTMISRVYVSAECQLRLL